MIGINWLVSLLVTTLPVAMALKFHCDYKQWILPVIGVLVLLFGLVKPIATHSKNVSWEYRLIGVVALGACCVLASPAIYHYVHPSIPKDPVTERAFLLIAKNKPHEFYDFLLEAEQKNKEINLIATNKEGWSMLHLLVALSLENPTWAVVLERVLIYHPPVNLVGVGCYTPLHLAAQLGSQEICEKLIKAGANPYLLTEAGHRPCDVAGLQGHLSLAAWLEKQLNLPVEEVEGLSTVVKPIH